MKSQEELRTLYEAKLKPRMARQESDRKLIKLLYILTICLLILALISFIFLGDIGNTLMLFFVFSGAVSWIKHDRAYKEYKKTFKSNVVKEIVKLINSEYLYDAKNHISEQDYNASGLFDYGYERYRGDDLITGIIDKTPFSFSEFKIEKTKNSKKLKKGSQKNQPKNTGIITEWESILQGEFFVAEFNKNLSERSFVVPEKAHANLMGKEKTKIDNYGELIKLENPEFEKVYSVYGSSQQEARYVLTPKMMEAMLNIQKTLNLKFYFSFIDAKVYCAIPMKKNMFEPNINRGIKYRDVEEMYMILSLIEVIITEMNLNTRIWTKE